MPRKPTKQGGGAYFIAPAFFIPYIRQTQNTAKQRERDTKRPPRDKIHGERLNAREVIYKKLIFIIFNNVFLRLQRRDNINERGDQTKGAELSGNGQPHERNREATA